MTVFSYDFFILWAVTIVLYYTVAKKWQWQLLLIASVIFYVKSISSIPWILIAVWLLTYSSGRYLESHKDKKGKAICYVTIVLCVAVLMTGRLTSIFVTLGNSYFILKAIGYVIDTYRDKKPEKDIFRFLLYLIYWPTILEGPFNRIEKFNKSFGIEIRFDYVGFTHGLQRFIWGTFKKLVISERVGLISNSILSSPEGKGGVYVVLGVVLFAIQLYTDFSGFMDMMLGLSESFGIKLPENFKQPYFSKSIPEFWRRWHITLGEWFRDYVMFPFSTSKFIKRTAKKIRKKNKTLGKLMPIILGTCLVWVMTGLWHGFSKNYLIWGCYYAILMCISQIIDFTFYKKRKKKNNVIVNGMRIFRTFALVIVADTLICVQGLSNVRVLWNEIIYNFLGESINAIKALDGVTINNLIVCAVAMLLLLINSIFSEKKGSVRMILDKMPIFVRWGIYYILIFGILIFGLYDTQYDASQFMYMQF